MTEVNYQLTFTCIYYIIGSDKVSFIIIIYLIFVFSYKYIILGPIIQCYLTK